MTRRRDNHNAPPANVTHGALRYMRSQRHLHGRDRTGARAGRDDVGSIEQDTWRGRDQEVRRMHATPSASGSGRTTERDAAAETVIEPKRSQADRQVREDVCETLTVHNVVDATAIEVDVKEGIVTLSGTVCSREERRLAQDAVYDVPGVLDVVNNLRVVPRDVVAPFER